MKQSPTQSPGFDSSNKMASNAGILLVRIHERRTDYFLQIFLLCISSLNYYRVI